MQVLRRQADAFYAVLPVVPQTGQPALAGAADAGKMQQLPRAGRYSLMADDEPNHSSCNMHLRWACVSDKGRVRQENEDSFWADEEHGLFIVSDGMGGHAEGARASQIVVEELPSILTEKLGRLKGKSSRSVRRVIHKSIVDLNQKVRTEGTDGNGHKNMGATLVMAMRHNDRLYIANVGDSRAYLFRKNRLRQITVDHTFVAELLEQGQIEPEETKYHPQQHVLTQCVGVDSEIRPFIRSIAVKKGDRLLLCSDGLTVVVPDKNIRLVIKNHTDLQSLCRELTAEANEAGGPDNTTVLIINIG
jgi:serine/threonine protein phosphatase PrpC